MAGRARWLGVLAVGLSGAGPSGGPLQLAHPGLRAGVEQSLRAAVEANPDDARARVALGALLARDGRCAAAAAQFGPVRALPNYGIEEVLSEGDCALRIGDLATAIERFEHAQSLAPRRSRVTLQRALALEAARDLAGARAALGHLRRHDTHQAHADYLEARLALGTPAFDVAFAALARAVETPEGARFRNAATALDAQAHLLAGGPAAARAVLHQGLMRHRANPTLLVLDAEALRRLGEALMADRTFDMPGLAGVASPYQLAVRARIAVDRGEFDRAAELLAAHPDPSDPELVASAWYLARATGGDATRYESLYATVRLPKHGALDLLIPEAP